MAGGTNLYGYAAGDPVNFDDPFGLSSCKKDSTDEEKAECERKEAEEREAYNACVESNSFSSMIRDVTGSETAGAVASVVEFAAPISLAADVHAFSLKSTRGFWRGSGANYASGFNWAAKKVINRAGGGARLLGNVRKIGDFGSVPTAVVGAFTLGYNLSILAQCKMGAIK